VLLVGSVTLGDSATTKPAARLAAIALFV